MGHSIVLINSECSDFAALHCTRGFLYMCTCTCTMYVYIFAVCTVLHFALFVYIILLMRHVTNMEVVSRTGQRRLQDNVAERRLRMAGHIIGMTSGRPANHDHAMSWTPRGSGRRRGRPTKTWRSTFKEDLVDRGVDWNSVRAVATNRSRWRTLAAHCPVKDRRI